MEQWGIEFIGYLQFSEHDWEYYTGDHYVIQGEPFAVSSKVKSKAKPYSSKKRAENAINSMYGKFANVAQAKVIPL